jgi:hypothetical protein
VRQNEGRIDPRNKGEVVLGKGRINLTVRVVEEVKWTMNSTCCDLGAEVIVGGRETREKLYWLGCFERGSVATQSLVKD